jgi:hypothetical protein
MPPGAGYLFCLGARMGRCCHAALNPCGREAGQQFSPLNPPMGKIFVFVEFSEVSRGPWSTLGENNTFVISDRKTGRELAQASKHADAQ